MLKKSQHSKTTPLNSSGPFPNSGRVPSNPQGTTNHTHPNDPIPPSQIPIPLPKTPCTKSTQKKPKQHLSLSKNQITPPSLKKKQMKKNTSTVSQQATSNHHNYRYLIFLQSPRSKVQLQVKSSQSSKSGPEKEESKNQEFTNLIHPSSKDLNHT